MKLYIKCLFKVLICFPAVKNNINFAALFIFNELDMKIIIDSGATKADWVLLNQEATVHKSTSGFNPTSTNPTAFLADYRQQPFDLAEKVEQVYFYGAGCATELGIRLVQSTLQPLFPNAQIHVTTDLIGAALATSNGKASVVCLLGTGSNSCLFNGTKIIDQIPNLGYLLGDEGSGFALGKALLQAYFYRQLSHQTNVLFQDTYQLTRRDLIHKLYHEDSPNKTIASFALFVTKNKQLTDIQSIITNVLNYFINNHVSQYNLTTSIPIHFVGSIAYLFRDRLEEILERKDLKVGTFLRKPIEGLVNYHR